MRISLLSAYFNFLPKRPVAALRFVVKILTRATTVRILEIIRRQFLSYEFHYFLLISASCRNVQKVLTAATQYKHAVMFLCPLRPWIEEQKETTVKY